MSDAETRTELEEFKEKVKGLVAVLYCASGCSCCRDDATWEASQEALAELLGVEPYDDNSGRDWHSVKNEYEAKNGKMKQP